MPACSVGGIYLRLFLSQGHRASPRLGYFFLNCNTAIENRNTLCMIQPTAL